MSNLDNGVTSVTVDDNFHRVWSVTPIHLPKIKNDCDGKTKCTLEMITIT